MFGYRDKFFSRLLIIFETAEVVTPKHMPISAKDNPYSSNNNPASFNRIIGNLPLRLPERNSGLGMFSFLQTFSINSSTLRSFSLKGNGRLIRFFQRMIMNFAMTELSVIIIYWETHSYVGSGIGSAENRAKNL